MTLQKCPKRDRLVTDASRQIQRGYDARNPIRRTTLRPVTEHRHPISLLQAISLAPERRLPESTPQPASTLSSVPTGSSALSPVSQPPSSGSPVSLYLCRDL